MRRMESGPRGLRMPKAAAAAAALAAVLAFGGTATVLGLSGSDHTKRLEELQQNRMVEAADTVSADTKLVALPIDRGTLTLAQADEKKIADEEGKILIAAQTLTDVDGEDGVRMLLALIESAEEVHVQSAYLVGFDADGKQMESAAEASVSPVLLADRQSVVTAEIEPHAMDGAERFELRLNIEREPEMRRRRTGRGRGTARPLFRGDADRRRGRRRRGQRICEHLGDGRRRHAARRIQRVAG